MHCRLVSSNCLLVLNTLLVAAVRMALMALVPRLRQVRETSFFSMNVLASKCAKMSEMISSDKVQLETTRIPLARLLPVLLFSSPFSGHTNRNYDG